MVVPCVVHLPQLRAPFDGSKREVEAEVRRTLGFGDAEYAALRAGEAAAGVGAGGAARRVVGVVVLDSFDEIADAAHTAAGVPVGCVDVRANVVRHSGLVEAFARGRLVVVVTSREERISGVKGMGELFGVRAEQAAS